MHKTPEFVILQIFVVMFLENVGHHSKQWILLNVKKVVMIMKVRHFNAHS